MAAVSHAAAAVVTVAAAGIEKEKRDSKSCLVFCALHLRLHPVVFSHDGVADLLTLGIIEFNEFHEDVSADRKTAPHIAEKLNRHQLSPIHLIDAIQDIL